MHYFAAPGLSGVPVSGLGNIPASVPNGDAVVQRFWSISGTAQREGRQNPFSWGFSQTVVQTPRNATIDQLARALGTYNTATIYYVAGMLRGSPVNAHLLGTRDRGGPLAGDAGQVWDYITKLGAGARALDRLINPPRLASRRR